MTYRVTQSPGDSLPLRCVHYLSDVRLDHGGVTRAVLDWCSVLALRGNLVTLITYDDRDVPPKWRLREPGVPRVLVVEAPRRGGRRLASSAMLAAEQVIQEADVLHLHAPWLIGNSQLASIARKHGVPYVLSTHGMLDDWCMARRALKKRLYLHWIGGRLLNQASVVHCTAEAELSQARKWFHNPRTVVLPCVFDTTQFSDLPGAGIARQRFPILETTGPKLLFLSRVDRKKGLELLIAAASQLAREGVLVTVLVAGPEHDSTYSAQLREQIKATQTQERIVFSGPVDGVEKLSLFQAADLMVLPTHQENFGLVLFESLACGTPVVTTRVDPWKEIEAAGGVIVDRTVNALANAIRSLLAHRETLPALGLRGRAWVMENLDADRIAGQYEQLYSGLPGRA